MIELRGTLVEIRQLKRAENKVLWLGENLPNHSLTCGVEPELLVRRTQTVLQAGDTAERLIMHQLGCQRSA